MASAVSCQVLYSVSNTCSVSPICQQSHGGRQRFQAEFRKPSSFLWVSLQTDIQATQSTSSRIRKGRYNVSQVRASDEASSNVTESQQAETSGTATTDSPVSSPSVESDASGPSKFSTPSPFAPGKLSSKLTSKAPPGQSNAKELNGTSQTQASPSAPISGAPSASTSTQIPSALATPKASPVSPFAVKPTAKVAVKGIDRLKGATVRPSPSFAGKKIVDAFKEGEKDGKTTKFGQPVTPANIFKDVRRTPEEIEADKWRFTVSSEQLLLLISFLATSTIMLGTVFLVWKVGAIHFNE